MERSFARKFMSLMFVLTFIVASTAPAFAEEEAKDEVQTAGYKKGFFIQSKDGKFKSTINGRVQTRFTWKGNDGGDNEYNFSVPRARLKLKGHAFSKRIKYAFQTDFGKGSATLKDFYVDGAIIPNKLHLRVGQMKRPFARQAITSSSKLEFVDRAFGGKLFQDGRDLGLMFHNNYTKAKGFEWAFGVFNGTGDKPWFDGDVILVDDTEGTVAPNAKFTNVPKQFHPAMVLRLGYNYGGIKGYSEADLEGGGFRFAVAGAAFLGIENAAGMSDFKTGGDYVIKAHGFSHTGSYYVWWNGADLGDLDYLLSVANAQVGYVLGDKIQPVLRYSYGNPRSADNTQQEILAGLNYFLFGHNVKWQTDGGVRFDQNDGGDELTNWIVRTQLQFGF